MPLNEGEKTISLPSSYMKHELADKFILCSNSNILIQGQEVAEKKSASPQNSAFESRTLQDSQCSMTIPKPHSETWNISFRNGNVLRRFIFGSQNKNISRLNSLKRAINQEQYKRRLVTSEHFLKQEQI